MRSNQAPWLHGADTRARWCRCFAAPLIARPRWSCKIDLDSRLVELMWRSAVVGTYLAVSAGTLVSGCAATCVANPQKLPSLQPGMSYPEPSPATASPAQLVSA